jgi:serine/threonine-protein kinase
VKPERWDHIGELFDMALTMTPGERDGWLRRACDGDEDLRSEVANLLAQDDRAARSGFLADPRESAPALDQTPDWLSRGNQVLSNGSGRGEQAESVEGVYSEGFTPKAAIAPGDGDWLADETPLSGRDCAKWP